MLHGAAQLIAKAYLPSSQLSPQLTSTLIGTFSGRALHISAPNELGLRRGGVPWDVEDQFVVNLDEHS